MLTPRIMTLGRLWVVKLNDTWLVLQDQFWEHFLKCLKPFGMPAASTEKGFNNREKNLKSLPRVRIELMTFRFSKSDY